MSRHHSIKNIENTITRRRGKLTVLLTVGFPTHLIQMLKILLFMSGGHVLPTRNGSTMRLPPTTQYYSPIIYQSIHGGLPQLFLRTIRHDIRVNNTLQSTTRVRRYNGTTILFNLLPRLHRNRDIQPKDTIQDYHTKTSKITIRQPTTHGTRNRHRRNNGRHRNRTLRLVPANQRA